MQDKNFYSISFHSTLEYLSLDFKNIKELLRCITKYIKNKSIQSNKVNDVPDLKRIGKVAWNFISASYESNWDSLITDKDNCSFWQKIKLKFTPNIQVFKNKAKNKEKNQQTSKFCQTPAFYYSKNSKESQQNLPVLQEEQSINWKENQK